MNKKATVSIALLVFMAIALFGTAIYSFATNKTNSVSFIEESRFVEVFVEEEMFVSERNEIGEQAFVKTYFDFAEGVEGYDYIENRVSVQGVPVFSNVHPAYRERFIERFVFYFNEGNDLSDLKVEDVNFNEGVSFVREFNSSKENGDKTFSVDYNRAVNFNFVFDEIGLNGFEEIFSAKEKCKGFAGGEKVDCLAFALDNFYVSLEKIDNRDVIVLESKKDFFVDEKFEKVSFRFIE